MTNIINITHKDTDGVICAILLYNFAISKGCGFQKLPVTYRNVDDVFKRYYNDKDFFFITDISIQDENIIPSIETKKNIFIIDHHERKFPSRIQKQILKTNEGAACTLVYNYLESKGYKFSRSLEKLKMLGEDYDTWTHQYKTSKHLNRLFFFYWFKDFFIRFSHGYDGTLLEAERRFLVAKQKEIDILLKNLKYEKIADEVAFIATSGDIDEVADFIINLHNMELVIVYNSKNSALSFRSKKDSKLDLSVALEKFGGGGHKHAGGVIVKNDDEIEKIVEYICELL